MIYADECLTCPHFDLLRSEEQKAKDWVAENKRSYVFTCRGSFNPSNLNYSPSEVSTANCYLHKNDDDLLSKFPGFSEAKNISD